MLPDFAAAGTKLCDSLVFVVKADKQAFSAMPRSDKDAEIFFGGQFFGLTKRLRLDDRIFFQETSGDAFTGRGVLTKVLGIRSEHTTPETSRAWPAIVTLQHTRGWGDLAEFPAERMAEVTHEAPQAATFPVLAGDVGREPTKSVSLPVFPAERETAEPPKAAEQAGSVVSDLQKFLGY